MTWDNWKRFWATIIVITLWLNGFMLGAKFRIIEADGYNTFIFAYTVSLLIIVNSLILFYMDESSGWFYAWRKI